MCHSENREILRNLRFSENGRGDRIRTCDILLPKQARYQTAPLPDASGSPIQV